MYIEYFWNKKYMGQWSTDKSVDWTSHQIPKNGDQQMGNYNFDVSMKKLAGEKIG